MPPSVWLKYIYIKNTLGVHSNLMCLCQEKDFLEGTVQYNTVIADSMVQLYMPISASFVSYWGFPRCLKESWHWQVSLLAVYVNLNLENKLNIIIKKKANVHKYEYIYLSKEPNTAVDVARHIHLSKWWLFFLPLTLYFAWETNRI